MRIADCGLRDSKFAMQSGFTLLEVVVAMVIVGLGVVTLLELFSAGLRLEARSSSSTDAVTYARQAMDAVVSRRDLSDGQQEGSFAGKYRWTVTVAPVQEETALSSPGAWRLKEITLQMNFSEGEGEKKIEFRTLRLVKGSP